MLVSVLLYGCGGSGNNESPSPNPGTGSGNPCGSAALETESVPALAGTLEETPPGSKGKAVVDGGSRWRVLDALWIHRQYAERNPPALQLSTGGGNAADVGDIAIVQDSGDVILPPNQLDLRGAGLRFSRNGAGGYDVRRIDGTFRQTLGRQLTLSDDDTVEVDVPFPFTFYGRTQRATFVNSDGNVTFEEGDRASTERNVGRLLTGSPRVAPFLADLDPSAGGRMFVNATSDQYTVTWCSVRGFDSTRTITVQTTLLPDGTVEMKYGDAASLGDAVIGVSPGHTGEFQPVNLSDTGPTSGSGAAVGERFSEQLELDVVALTRKFYQTHPDNYDQLVIWTDTALVRDAFAYETTVANQIHGIGVDISDASRDFGSSGGQLSSFAVMDWIGQYPDDPQEKFLGENNTLSVLGQEVGHRWLAFLEFRDLNGQDSKALLGRGDAHWSFFFDSDASVMEGNDIEDLGGGSFRTVAAVERYSLLDQYAMGLVPASQVPPFFYVENPVNVTPTRRAESAPQVGVTFNGTRRTVLIQDVIAVLGNRTPSVADSPKVHRQAFVYLVSNNRSAEGSAVDKVDRIRRLWEPFFLQATDGRMTVETRLR